VRRLLCIKILSALAEHMVGHLLLELKCLTLGLHAIVSCNVRLWKPEISAINLQERRGVMSLALCLQICCSIGKRYVCLYSEFRLGGSFECSTDAFFHCCLYFSRDFERC
jgi:hypothetical protein